MKRILITGASGFIGSFITEEALRQGWDVIAAVRKTSPRTWLNQKGLHIETLDLADKTLLTAQIQDLQSRVGQLDYVVHNAGITQANRKEEFISVNYQFTKNLTEVLISETSVQKFVFISSLAAMGPGDPKSFTPLQPEDKAQPVSAYGRSKQLAEEFLRSLPGFPSLIVRPTAVYGPRDKDFLQFFSMVNGGFEPTIGWHRQMVSMIHVTDLASSIIRLTEKSRAGRIYLASDGQSYDKQMLGEFVRKSLSRKTLRIKLPLTPIKAAVSANEMAHQLFGRMPFLNLDKLREISSANWLCNSSGMWEEIGIQPRYMLQEGLTQTAEWYKQMGWLK